MDSQERHELKENELAEFFQNFGEWWAKWGNTVLLILVVLAGGFAIYRFYEYSTTTRHETAWTDLATATTGERFLAVAEQHGNSAVQALAYLRAGDLFLEQSFEGERPEPMLEVEGETATAAEEQELEPEEALERAELAYQRALEVSDEPAYRANAMLGLAAIAESRQQWDQAEDYYEQVIDLARETLPHVAAKAQRRQGMLGQLQQPIVFAPEDAVPNLPQQPGGVPGLEGMPMGPPPGAQEGEAGVPETFLPEQETGIDGETETLPGLSDEGEEPVEPTFDIDELDLDQEPAQTPESAPED